MPTDSTLAESLPISWVPTGRIAVTKRRHRPKPDICIRRFYVGLPTSLLELMGNPARVCTFYDHWDLIVVPASLATGHGHRLFMRGQQGRILDVHLRNVVRRGIYPLDIGYTITDQVGMKVVRIKNCINICVTPEQIKITGDGFNVAFRSVANNDVTERLRASMSQDHRPSA